MTKKLFKIIGIKRWRSLFKLLKRPLFTKFLIKISDTYFFIWRISTIWYQTRKWKEKPQCTNFCHSWRMNQPWITIAKKYIIAGSWPGKKSRPTFDSDFANHPKQQWEFFHKFFFLKITADLFHKTLVSCPIPVTSFQKKSLKVSGMTFWKYHML